MEEERIVSDCEEDDTDESKLFLFRFEDHFLSSVLRLKGGTRGRGARRRVLVVEFIREIRAEFHFALSRRATDAAGQRKGGRGRLTIGRGGREERKGANSRRRSVEKG